MAYTVAGKEDDIRTQLTPACDDNNLNPDTGVYYVRMSSLFTSIDRNQLKLVGSYVC